LDIRSNRTTVQSAEQPPFAPPHCQANDVSHRLETAHGCTVTLSLRTANTLPHRPANACPVEVEQGAYFRTDTADRAALKAAHKATDQTTDQATNKSTDPAALETAFKTAYEPTFIADIQSHCSYASTYGDPALIASVVTALSLAVFPANESAHDTPYDFITAHNAPVESSVRRTQRASDRGACDRSAYGLL
jgi:hypothetical protein